jgi:hypothetical protein
MRAPKSSSFPSSGAAAAAAAAADADLLRLVDMSPSTFVLLLCAL